MSDDVVLPERIAPTGAIWVCAACGKTSQDLYGIEGDCAKGWDESCVLNAVLCKYPQENDRWEAIGG
jgi:hypothetical protein